MKLSKRLQTIHNMVKSPCIVADIGCDHGLLPIALIESKTCAKAYACDINEGPLSRARQAIQDAGLQNKIEPVLCDGLDALNEHVTTVIIAGMGYDTITGILSANMNKLKHYKQIIIQCNNHVSELRQWLSAHGLCIDDEQLVKEHHFYQMLSIHVEEQKLDKEHCMFGLYLDRHPLFITYWTFVLYKQQQILHNLNEGHASFYRTKHIIKLIEKKLRELS